MIQIQVRLFAQARDLVGVDAVAIDLPAGSTAGELRNQLAARYPQLAPLLAHSMLAVNLAFVGDDAALADGCEAAVIPPVSGG